MFFHRKHFHALHSNPQKRKKKNTSSEDEVFFLVCPAGFEPATSGSASQRSIQLSYGHVAQQRL